MKTRATFIVGLGLLLSACGYNAPNYPTPVTVAPSTAPASIVMTEASGLNYTTTVTAIVYTADKNRVPNTTVVFGVGAGTLSPAQGVTDASGQVTTTVTSANNTAVTAAVGSITSSIQVAGASAPVTPPATFIPTPPVSPTPPPAAPAIQLTYGSNTAVIGTSVGFTATGSFGSGTSAFNWAFGDGGVAVTQGPATNHTYASTGAFPVTVSMVDSLGRASSNTAILTIVAAPPAAPTPAPTLSAVLNCTAPTAHGTPASCNITAAYGGTALLSTAITNTAWDWGDGTAHVTAVPVDTYTYPVAGTYPVTATITATTVDGVKTATTSKTLTVP